MLPGKVELVIPAEYALGEAPHWDEKSNTLLYVDCISGSVYRWNPVTKETKCTVVEDAKVGVGCAVPREKGGLVVAAGHRFAFLDENSGEMKTIQEISPEHQGTHFNDGKCDPSGRFWAGTMGEMVKLGEPKLQQGRLYCLDTNGKCAEKSLNPIDISNGMSWSSDKKTMFHCDSLKFAIDAYDYDVTTGNISNGRTVGSFEKEEGLPDGHCLDTDGNIWVAMHMGGCLIKLDPRTGKRLGQITISETATRVTSLCFGGVNMDELFVTTAKSLQPKPGKDDGGSVFKVTETGAKGSPANAYLG